MTIDGNFFSAGSLLSGREELVERLYAKARGSHWRLSMAAFAEALTRSAKKRFTSVGASLEQLEEYLFALHLEDLALACACCEGNEAAWEHFIGMYRGYLRSAAGAILGSDAESPEARELADGLFADIYGWKSKTPERHSLFRYFHGRSKLSTWLRAVLAQRHVDAVRARRRLQTLDDRTDGRQGPGERDSVSPTPLDPDRSRYVALFRRALDAALARLEPRDVQRLTLYYRDERTLADIGRRFGEHESSVSRNLERIRGQLRSDVEAMLRLGFSQADGQAAEGGLSEAQIALCVEYALEDVPLDLGGALGSSQGPEAQRQKT